MQNILTQVRLNFKLNRLTLTPEDGRKRLNHVACIVGYNKFVVFDGNAYIIIRWSQHNGLNSIENGVSWVDSPLLSCRLCAMKCVPQTRISSHLLGALGHTT